MKDEKQESPIVKFLEKYKSNLSFRISKPEAVIVKYLNNDLQFHQIESNTFKIIKKPTYFNPYEGRGYINLTILNEAKITLIKAEVVPTSVTKESLCVFISILSIWTIAALVISTSIYSFLTVFAGWITFLFVLHLIQRLSQGKLENYLNALIKELKKLKS